MPAPNVVQRQNVAPQTHIEQPNLVTHDYVPRSARLGNEAHALPPVNQSAPAPVQSEPHYQQGNSGRIGNGGGNHSAPAPVQSEPHYQQGNSGGIGNGGGNGHNSGGNVNSGGNGNNGGGNNGGNNNSWGGHNGR